MLLLSQPKKGNLAPLPQTNTTPQKKALFSLETKDGLKILETPQGGVNIMISRPDPRCADLIPYTGIKAREAFNLYRACRANFISSLCDRSYYLMVEAARNLYEVSGGKIVVSIPNYECRELIPITK